MYLPPQLLSVLVTTLLPSPCCFQQAPPNQFHERAQRSSLDSFFFLFFKKGVGLVYWLLATAENDEVLEYCIASLQNLLACVNIFHILEGQLNWTTPVLRSCILGYQVRKSFPWLDQLLFWLEKTSQTLPSWCEGKVIYHDDNLEISWGYHDI